MNIELGTIYEQLLQIIFPLLRIGAFMLASPLFTVDALNLRFRIAIALVLAVFIMNAGPLPEVDILSVSGISIAFTEVFIGFVLGFILQIVIAAFTVAGAFVSNSIGLSFANIIDPAMGNVPVISQLLLILGTLVFLALDGHIVLVRNLVESFALIPIGNYPDFSGWFNFVVDWSAMTFIGGLILALPAVVSLLIVNFGLAIVTRAAPAMNIFSIGFSALMICGFIFVYIYMPGVIYFMRDFWASGVTTFSSLLL